MKTIAVILGTRPEAIKLAPVILNLREQSDARCRVVATGQHRELARDALAEFGIEPCIDLGVMQPNQTLADLSSRLLTELDREFEQFRPDAVLIQGDTTSAFIGALAAFYRKIPIGHVEAGLRTGDLQAPWPEEANRALISRIADLHFAPTETARANLVREGIDPAHIHVTGNTAVDALLWMRERVRRDQKGASNNGPMVLITAHRREHFGKRFEAVCEAIAELAEKFPAVSFVFPVHPNPQVREPVERILGSTHPNIQLVAPQGYSEFVALMDACTLILTDSGGIQEEAPSLGKPVLVLRDATERPEAVEAGTVRIVGTDRARIVAETSRLLLDADARQAMCRLHNPYGDGRAAERIVGQVISELRAR